jgi:hypothetical protein
MSLLKNGYADLYNEATGGGGGGPSNSLSGLNDCNNQTSIDTLSIGIKASGINTANNVLVMNNIPTFTNIGPENTLIGNCCQNSSGGAGFVANTIAGSNAGDVCIGESNCLYGYQSGANLTTGDRNTYIGAQSAPLASTGSDNICYGFNSGLNMTTASNCIMLGPNTSNLNNLDGVICIGKDVVGTVANGLFLPSPLAQVSNNPQTKLMTFNNLSGNAGPTSLVTANGYLKNTAGLLSWETVTPASAGYSNLYIYTTPMAWVRQANTVIPFENIDVSNSNGSLSVVNLSTVRFLQAGIYQIDLTFQILPTSTGKINLELESRNITISSIVGTPARVGYFNVQSNEIFTISSFSVITFSANDELQFSLNTVNTLIVDGATGNINNVSIKITRIT